MSKSRKKAKSLSEQLAELSTPKPVSYHPDEEDQADLTAAKVCKYTEEDEINFRPKRVKIADEFSDDPRYSGRPVCRKDLGDSEDDSFVDSDKEPQDLISSEDHELSEDEVRSDVETDQSESEGNGHMTDSDQSNLSLKDAKLEVSGLSTISLESLKQDIAKGKAAKHQLAVWDGLLEARIKLHKVQGACNQLPQGERLEQFIEAGGEQMQETVEEFRLELQHLMDDLLDLQRTLLLRNSETSSIVGGASCHDNSDEEIPSDSEDSDDDHQNEPNDGGRKRQRPEWVDEDGTPDYEGHISRVYEAFQIYRDNTIAKWNSKTRIAGGKVTNKSFIEVDQTVLSQIKHILADKPRLLKRTQLKRSVYRVLGTCEGEEPQMDQSDSGRDAHLKDYDDEIFDDDDFYHQLLRELIERKMDLTESSDPVAMGRQWLQLQRLRAKAKKNVDTKASKGRKIRYNIHPKLANFMVPIATGTMSDVSKNDLFSSLFGAHQYRTDSKI